MVSTVFFIHPLNLLNRTYFLTSGYGSINVKTFEYNHVPTLSKLRTLKRDLANQVIHPFDIDNLAPTIFQRAIALYAVLGW